MVTIYRLLPTLLPSSLEMSIALNSFLGSGKGSFEKKDRYSPMLKIRNEIPNDSVMYHETLLLWAGHCAMSKSGFLLTTSHKKVDCVS